MKRKEHNLSTGRPVLTLLSARFGGSTDFAGLGQTSTLMKCFYGILTKRSGVLSLGNNKAEFFMCTRSVIPREKLRYLLIGGFLEMLFIMLFIVIFHGLQ